MEEDVNNSYSIIYDAMLILKQEEMLGQVLALKLGGILLLAWMLAIDLAFERALYFNLLRVLQLELELVMYLYLCT